MDIKNLLRPADVVVDLRAPDKRRVLEEVARRAAAALSIDPDGIIEAVAARERLGSTGMGEGAAIPHARLAEVKEAFGIFARLEHPANFDAIDARPVDLVFLLLLPESGPGGQLNALACVARRLRNTAVLDRLRRAANADALYRALVE